MAKEEFAYRLDIDPDLAVAVDARLAELGTNRKEGVSRILQWFLDAQPTVQAHMLRQLPKDMTEEIARLLYEQMAGKKGSKVRKRGAKKRPGS